MEEVTFIWRCYDHYDPARRKLKREDVLDADTAARVLRGERYVKVIAEEDGTTTIQFNFHRTLTPSSPNWHEAMVARGVFVNGHYGKKRARFDY
jgi:hypothetical protein